MYPIVREGRVAGVLELKKKHIEWLRKEYKLIEIKNFLLCDDGALRPQ